MITREVLIIGHFIDNHWWSQVLLLVVLQTSFIMLLALIQYLIIKKERLVMSEKNIDVDEMNSFSVGMMFDWSDLARAFIQGAREVKKNPNVSDEIIIRSADAYTKSLQLTKYLEFKNHR